MFICNHCPFVVHVREGIEALARDYLSREVALVAINSNSLQTHSQDGPAAMKRLAEERAWAFPFLFDETQRVAQAFQAACTPDFYLFDGATKLVYRGQLDDSRPGNGRPVTGRDLRTALDAVLAGKPVPGSANPEHWLQHQMDARSGPGLRSLTYQSNLPAYDLRTSLVAQCYRLRPGRTADDRGCSEAQYERKSVPTGRIVLQALREVSAEALRKYPSSLATPFPGAGGAHPWRPDGECHRHQRRRRTVAPRLRDVCRNGRARGRDGAKRMSFMASWRLCTARRWSRCR